MKMEARQQPWLELEGKQTTQLAVYHGVFCMIRKGQTWTDHGLAHLVELLMAPLLTSVSTRWANHGQTEFRRADILH